MATMDLASGILRALNVFEIGDIIRHQDVGG
jgi:hypothetical protein